MVSVDNHQQLKARIMREQLKLHLELSYQAPELTLPPGAMSFENSDFSLGNTTPSVAEEGNSQLQLSDLLDMPQLVSDNEDDSDGETTCDKHGKVSAAAEEVKKSMKAELPQYSASECPLKDPGSVKQSMEATTSKQAELQLLSSKEFAEERTKIMVIAVKYIAMKITNSFPPALPYLVDPNELPLDKFLMILVSRLQLSLNLFMKGVVYLFRYMDVVYLLRYLNQLNNFANYTNMGHDLRKLIVACFRIATAKEKLTKDWVGTTGLSNAEINKVLKSVVNRLNKRLLIRDVELVRLKLEIFRFVKMTTKAI